MKIKLFFLLIFLLIFIGLTETVNADENQINHRMNLYKEYALKTNLPWYIIAAVDQYERNTKNYRSYCPKEDEVISICFDPKIWSGINNPNQEDQNPHTIELFHGMGVDGDNDGFANRLNRYDRLNAMIDFILQYGFTTDRVEEALLDYYNSERGVEIIFIISKIFDHFQTIDLSERVHPIPRRYLASMVNNYGAGRSFGGRRAHEGVDIFAHYGTPVVSTAYGYVEIKGWNRLGGYRIGVRDIHNTYEFYAHLQGYGKGMEEGVFVKPGQVIGYVGSTGYGKEGTSGKFPPHLHFGFYKFDGEKEWSFNPYRFLRKWKRI